MVDDDLQALVGRVLREAPFAMRQLAADSGLSYDVLRSWRSGRRRPSRASAQRLADGLERRSDLLRDLARELRGATQQRPVAEPRTPVEPRGTGEERREPDLGAAGELRSPSGRVLPERSAPAYEPGRSGYRGPGEQRRPVEQR